MFFKVLNGTQFKIYPLKFYSKTQNERQYYNIKLYSFLNDIIKNFLLIENIFSNFTGLLLLVSMIIFTALVSISGIKKWSSEAIQFNYREVSYGYSFILGWVAFGIGFILTIVSLFGQDEEALDCFCNICIGIMKVISAVFQHL